MKKTSKWNNKTEYFVLLTVFVLVLLSLSRYCMQGEPRRVISDDAAYTELFISDGIEVRQPLTLTEEMNWRQGAYGLKFVTIPSESQGKLLLCIEQGQTVVAEAEMSMQELLNAEMSMQELTNTEMSMQDMTGIGSFIPLPLDFAQLNAGEAVLVIRTEGVKEQELSLAYGTDYYGFGETLINGEAETEQTLFQCYSYHMQDSEYRIRLFCYGFVVFGMVLLGLLIIGREESRARCYAVFVILTGIFLAMFYIYDSSVILEPTYAEAVTNFMKYAREESLFSNLLLTDAGYLPFLPRLITLFFIKLLRIPAANALYLMQLSACVLCSMLWAFFCLEPFCKYMNLSLRVVFSMLVMMVCFYQETVFFTNFSYWGILLILLFMLSEMEQWNLLEFWVITAFCALYCLSKGAYAVLLPFFVLWLLFFYRELNKRQKQYGLCMIGAALLQLLYSFSGQGDGGNWIRADKFGTPGYLLQLCGTVLTDMAASLCRFLGDGIEKLGSVFCIITVILTILIVEGFVRKVLLPKLHREQVREEWVSIYSLLLFLAINAAFYRVTTKVISGKWMDVLAASAASMGDKYEIFGSVAGVLILMLLLRQWQQKEVGILALFLAFCLTAPTMQVRGIGTTEISDSRVYAGDLNSSLKQTKELIDRDSFFLPVRGEWWSYSRNVNVYQLGTERYFEESSGTNLGMIEPGYYSLYTLADEMPCDNVIEVWINSPNRIWKMDDSIKMRLLDAEGNLLQETEQFGSNRNCKTGFVLDIPVNGVKTIQFLDADNNPVYSDAYLCYVSAY